MKKFLSLTLVICLLTGLLCGCTEEDKQEFQEFMRASAIELVSDLWHDLTDEVTSIYREAADIFIDGVNRWASITFNSYEKAMKKDWETILTSEYENETLRVMRRHGRMALVPGSYYMLTLEQDGVCTYYTPPAYKMCPKLTAFFWCAGEHSTLKGASQDDEMLQQLYPYLSDLMGCFVLTQLEQGKITVDEIQKAAINQLFYKLGNASIDSVMTGATAEAFGAIVQPNLFASELNGLAGLISSGADVQENFTSPDSPDFRYDPIVTAFVESFSLATKLIDIAAPKNYDNLEKMSHTATDWTHLVFLEELSPDGRKLNFQKNSTHIQWKYEDDENWQDLKAIDELPHNGHDVLFKVTNTEVFWRTRTDSEVYLYQLQAILHESFKFIAYPVD